MPISQKPRKKNAPGYGNRTKAEPQKSRWMDQAKGFVRGYSRKAYAYQQRNKHVLSDMCTAKNLEAL